MGKWKLSRHVRSHNQYALERGCAELYRGVCKEPSTPRIVQFWVIQTCYGCGWKSWLISLCPFRFLWIFRELFYLVYTLLLLVCLRNVFKEWLETFNTDSRQGRKWSWESREYSQYQSCDWSRVLSKPLPLSLPHLLWHYFSSEKNNKVNTVMLNHFPAYKWAYIKNSILRRVFYRAVNSFIKMMGKRWRDDKILGSNV